MLCQICGDVKNVKKWRVTACHSRLCGRLWWSTILLQKRYAAMTPEHPSPRWLLRRHWKRLEAANLTSRGLHSLEDYKEIHPLAIQVRVSFPQTLNSKNPKHTTINPHLLLVGYGARMHRNLAHLLRNVIVNFKFTNNYGLLFRNPSK